VRTVDVENLPVDIEELLLVDFKADLDGEPECCEYLSRFQKSCAIVATGQVISGSERGYRPVPRRW
jgi:hypothetical protein